MAQSQKWWSMGLLPLREELKSKGLETHGSKPVLVRRLEVYDERIKTLRAKSSPIQLHKSPAKVDSSKSASAPMKESGGDVPAKQPDDQKNGQKDAKTAPPDPPQEETKPQDWWTLSMQELKNECSKRNLSFMGNKYTLVNRLKGYNPQPSKKVEVPSTGKPPVSSPSAKDTPKTDTSTPAAKPTQGDTRQGTRPTQNLPQPATKPPPSQSPSQQAPKSTQSPSQQAPKSTQSPSQQAPKPTQSPSQQAPKAPLLKIPPSPSPAKDAPQPQQERQDTAAQKAEIDRINKLTLAQLKIECVNKKLNMTGSRTELLERLKQHLQNPKPSTKATPLSTPVVSSPSPAAGPKVNTIKVSTNNWSPVVAPKTTQQPATKPTTQPPPQPSPVKRLVTASVGIQTDKMQTDARDEVEKPQPLRTHYLDEQVEVAKKFSSKPPFWEDKGGKFPDVFLEYYPVLESEKRARSLLVYPLTFSDLHHQEFTKLRQTARSCVINFTDHRSLNRALTGSVELEFFTRKACQTAQDKLKSWKNHLKVELLSQHKDLDSAVVKVGMKPAKPEPTVNRLVFLNKLPMKLKEGSLAEKFSDAAAICIARDTLNVSKGYGFLEYGSPAEAQAAVNKYRNLFLEGVRVEVSLYPKVPANLQQDKHRLILPDSERVKLSEKHHQTTLDFNRAKSGPYNRDRSTDQTLLKEMSVLEEKLAVDAAIRKKLGFTSLPEPTGFMSTEMRKAWQTGDFSTFKVDLGGIHKDWGEPKLKETVPSKAEVKKDIPGPTPAKVTKMNDGNKGASAVPREEKIASSLVATLSQLKQTETEERKRKDPAGQQSSQWSGSDSSRQQNQPTGAQWKQDSNWSQQKQGNNSQQATWGDQKRNNNAQSSWNQQKQDKPQQSSWNQPKQDNKPQQSSWNQPKQDNKPQQSSWNQPKQDNKPQQSSWNQPKQDNKPQQSSWNQPKQDNKTQQSSWNQPKQDNKPQQSSWNQPKQDNKPLQSSWNQRDSASHGGMDAGKNTTSRFNDGKPSGFGVTSLMSADIKPSKLRDQQKSNLGDFGDSFPMQFGRPNQSSGFSDNQTRGDKSFGDNQSSKFGDRQSSRFGGSQSTQFGNKPMQQQSQDDDNQFEQETGFGKNQASRFGGASQKPGWGRGKTSAGLLDTPSLLGEKLGRGRGQMVQDFDDEEDIPSDHMGRGRGSFSRNLSSAGMNEGFRKFDKPSIGRGQQNQGLQMDKSQFNRTSNKGDVYDKFYGGGDVSESDNLRDAFPMSFGSTKKPDLPDEEEHQFGGGLRPAGGFGRRQAASQMEDMEFEEEEEDEASLAMGFGQKTFGRGGFSQQRGASRPGQKGFGRGSLHQEEEDFDDTIPGLMSSGRGGSNPASRMGRGANRGNFRQMGSDQGFSQFGKSGGNNMGRFDNDDEEMEFGQTQGGMNQKNNFGRKKGFDDMSQCFNKSTFGQNQGNFNQNRQKASFGEADEFDEGVLGQGTTRNAFGGNSLGRGQGSFGRGRQSNIGQRGVGFGRGGGLDEFMEEHVEEDEEGETYTYMPPNLSSKAPGQEDPMSGEGNQEGFRRTPGAGPRGSASQHKQFGKPMDTPKSQFGSGLNRRSESGQFAQEDNLNQQEGNPLDFPGFKGLNTGVPRGSPNQQRGGLNQQRGGPNLQRGGPNQQRGLNQQRGGPNQQRGGPTSGNEGPQPLLGRPTGQKNEVLDNPSDIGMRSQTSQMLSRPPPPVSKMSNTQPPTETNKPPLPSQPEQQNPPPPPPQYTEYDQKAYEEYYKQYGYDYSQGTYDYSQYPYPGYGQSGDWSQGYWGYQYNQPPPPTGKDEGGKTQQQPPAEGGQWGSYGYGQQPPALDGSVAPPTGPPPPWGAAAQPEAAQGAEETINTELLKKLGPAVTTLRQQMQHDTSKEKKSDSSNMPTFVSNMASYSSNKPQQGGYGGAYGGYQ